MIFAVDLDAVKQLLRTGQLRCPECDGPLRPWSRARTRRVRTPDGDSVELTPNRALCRACPATHVIVPAWYVPRRAYTVEVVGQVLLGAVDHVRRGDLAQRLRMPAGTAKDWLRRARHAAGALTRHAILVAPTAGQQRPEPRDALTLALHTLGDTAAAVTAMTTPAPAPVPTAGTGIDYLRLILDEHYRQLCRALHIADPLNSMTRLSAWQVVNLITARRGLFATSG
jgi:uncharacterized protein DUF6431